jgi:uncharacterized membrane protein
MKQIEYYWVLLSVLIDNQYEIGVVSQRWAEKQRRNAPGQPGLEGTLGQGLHITPTEQVIKQVGGKKKHLQSWCRPCMFVGTVIWSLILVILVQRFAAQLLVGCATQHTCIRSIFIIVFFTFVSIALFSFFLSIALKSSALVQNLCLWKAKIQKNHVLLQAGRHWKEFPI